MRTLWTIAGFDPSSGAGITADLAVFAAHGFFGVSAITALTVQSTTGVRATQAVQGEWLAQTLDCLADDLPPAGIKIGMLATEENVRQVTKFLVGLGTRDKALPVVLDPVLRSSSGRELLSAEGVDALRAELLPLVDWVTPNLDELAMLAQTPVSGVADMEAAAMQLVARFPGLSVVATGGHLDSADDLVVTEGCSTWLRGERIETRSTHGTGCAFSSSLAANLANGMNGLDASHRAKLYVSHALRKTPGLGSGNGPLGLLWPLQRG